MSQPTQQSLIEKVANMCANEQFDELRALVPVNIKKVFISGFRHAGGTLLHVCAHFGSVQCAAYLLRHGASPNLIDVYFIISKTPLVIAAWQGSSQIVVSLLRAGADPTIPEDSIRGYADVCHQLIKGGADPNATDFEGYTPLHMAAKSGHFETCEVIYRSGGDPYKQNNFAFTPIDFATRYGFDDIVQLLQTPRSKLLSMLSNRGDPPKSASSFREPTDRSSLKSGVTNDG